MATATEVLSIFPARWQQGDGAKGNLVIIACAPLETLLWRIPSHPSDMAGDTSLLWCQGGFGEW